LLGRVRQEEGGRRRVECKKNNDTKMQRREIRKAIKIEKKRKIKIGFWNVARLNNKDA